jgi:hypothetical protein
MVTSVSIIFKDGNSQSNEKLQDKCFVLLHVCLLLYNSENNIKNNNCGFVTKHQICVMCVTGQVLSFNYEEKNEISLCNYCILLV